MKVLIDECMPARLVLELAGFEATTVPKHGWASVKNGELLALAAQQFDAFVTIDKGLLFQNSILKLDLAVIGLSANSNSFNDVKPLVAELIGLLPRVEPGKFYRVPSDRDSIGSQDDQMG